MRKAFKTIIEVCVVCETEDQAREIMLGVLGDGDAGADFGFIDWRYRDWTEQHTNTWNPVEVLGAVEYREGSAFDDTAVPGHEEIRRVRDEILPEYVAIGEPGTFAARMMRADLDAAAKAILEGDIVAMLRFYESLKGYSL